jgi:hypothetical protein
MQQLIQKKHEPVTSTYIQPSLEIGEEEDEHEKEANSTADKVMRMCEPENEKKKMHTGIPAIQRMPTAEQKGMTVPPKVEQGIHSSKGSGQNLQVETQQEMGSKIGADFSDVNVHTDSNAVQMSKEIGAKAFTHGNDIYFNQGQYNPSSNEGKHLLAHELTHTVQQSGKINQKIQRVKDNLIKSHFGEWYTTEYYAQSAALFPGRVPPDYYAAQIELFFKANENVDAQQFGLVQTGHLKMEQGKNPPNTLQNEKGDVFENQNAKDRANDKGVFIDQTSKSLNPLYISTGKKGMGKSPVGVDQENVPIGQHGSHFYKDGVLQEPQKPASLFDVPHIDGVRSPKNASMELETTALALEGKNKNTYYGSVKWGWKINDSGEISIIPLKLTSEGIPSASYMSAADKWNNSKAEGSPDEVRDQLPLQNIITAEKTKSHLLNLMKGYDVDVIQSIINKPLTKGQIELFPLQLNNDKIYKIAAATGLTYDTLQWKLFDPGGNEVFDNAKYNYSADWSFDIGKGGGNFTVAVRLAPGAFYGSLVLLVGQQTEK